MAYFRIVLKSGFVLEGHFDQSGVQKFVESISDSEETGRLTYQPTLSSQQRIVMIVLSEVALYEVEKES